MRSDSGKSSLPDDLRDQVNKRLLQEPLIDMSEAKVQVFGSKVILRGLANSIFDVRRIEQVIKSIPGVKEVANKLWIKVKGNHAFEPVYLN